MDRICCCGKQCDRPSRWRKEAAGLPKRTRQCPGTQAWQVVMDQTGAPGDDAGSQALVPTRLPHGLVDRVDGLDPPTPLALPVFLPRKG